MGRTEKQAPLGYNRRVKTAANEGGGDGLQARRVCRVQRARTAAVCALALAVCMPTSRAQAQNGQPTQAGSSAVSARRFLVVVDAAHGGTEDGASLVRGGPTDGASGSAGSAMVVQEKDVTLAMSQTLRALLVARGFAVVQTRTGDQAMDGDARSEVANRAAAGACVVLHATEAGSGVHLFVSSLAPTPGTLLMPWKTAQAAWVAESLKLSSALNQALGASGKDDSAAIPVTMGRTTLPGIDSMGCPAVAVEVAPLRDGARRVTSDVTDREYQARVMQAVAAALLEWRGEAGEP